MQHPCVCFHPLPSSSWFNYWLCTTKLGLHALNRWPSFEDKKIKSNSNRKTMCGSIPFPQFQSLAQIPCHMLLTTGRKKAWALVLVVRKSNQEQLHHRGGCVLLLSISKKNGRLLKGGGWGLGALDVITVQVLTHNEMDKVGCYEDLSFLSGCILSDT